MRNLKKGQLYFSIVSCQNKSSLWLVMMFSLGHALSSVVYLPYVAVLASQLLTGDISDCEVVIFFFLCDCQCEAAVFVMFSSRC